MTILEKGVKGALSAALEDPKSVRRSEAAYAIDASRRAAEVGKAAAPESVFKGQLEQIRWTRHYLHMGDEKAAQERLAEAISMGSPVQADVADLIFGQVKTVGLTMVALPTRETAPLKSYAESPESNHPWMKSLDSQKLFVVLPSLPALGVS